MGRLRCGCATFRQLIWVGTMPFAYMAGWVSRFGETELEYRLIACAAVFFVWQLGYEWFGPRRLGCSAKPAKAKT